MRLRLRPRQIAPLAAIAMLVGVPALADTGVPGLVGGGSVTADPPPPVNVPVPVPEAVQQVQQTVQQTAGQVQQTAGQVQQTVQQVQQAATPQRNAPATTQQQPTRTATATSRAKPAAQPRVRSSARQRIRSATRRASGSSTRTTSIRQLRSRSAAHRSHGRAHRRSGHHAARHFAAPHPIARPLPQAILRSLAAQPPGYPAPSKARAHHSRLPFAHLGLPPAPSTPVLLLLLGGIGLAMLAAAGMMPSGFRNTSVGRRWRRLRSRRVTV